MLERHFTGLSNYQRPSSGKFPRAVAELLPHFDRLDNCILMLSSSGKGKQMMTATIGPNVGQIAPEINLPDAHGNIWNLSSARGKPVVLLFYPADETPVCTKQLCSVRDNWAQYQATGAEVVGINTDSVEKHRRFIEHHNLPLPLLSDSSGQIVRAYEMKNLIGTKRGVVVIDRNGVIRYRKVVLPIFRPGDDEVIEEIKKC
jgi:peroxiredoxin Q/BCP